MAPKITTRSSAAAEQAPEAADAELLGVKEEGSSSNAAASPATGAALTATQQAIQTILNIKSVRSLGDVLQELAKLDARPLPVTLPEDSRLPQTNPRTCCFGALGLWTCKSICARCSVLNDLVKIVQSEGSNVASNILGQALVTTDCISDSIRTGNFPGLPAELVQMVVQFALEEMQSSRDGSVVCALMHTSSIIRLQIVRAFETVKLHERATKQAKRSEELCIPFDFFSYLWRYLHFTLTDITAQRYEPERPVPPNSDDVLGAGRAIGGDAVRCNIEVVGDRVQLLGKKLIEEPLRRGKSWMTNGAAPHVTFRLAELCIGNALGRLGVPLLRPASVYERARGGSVGRPELSASIFVTLSLRKHGGAWETSFCRTWQFDTASRDT